MSARDGSCASLPLRATSPLTADGVDVDRARTLIAIGFLGALAGCHTCWSHRDYRPMKYGSVRDGFNYHWWRDCYRPRYHCGAPDGIRDNCSVRRAAIQSANRAIDEQCGGAVSRDFKFGFQQSYIDIANGGSGTIPAVPPPRYWTTPYRTLWGHNKARDWFAGYQAGANSAKCCMAPGSLSVPTSVYRDCDQRLPVGLDGTTYQQTSNVTTNYGWPGNGTSYPLSPMGRLQPMTPYANGLSPTSTYGAMSAPTPYLSPAAPMAAPSLGSSSYPNGVLGGGWTNSVNSTLPTYPPINATLSPTTIPNQSVPEVPGGGHSAPTIGVGTPIVPPISGHQTAPPMPTSRYIAPSNPWSRLIEGTGLGLSKEGDLR